MAGSLNCPCACLLSGPGGEGGLHHWHGHGSGAASGSARAGGAQRAWSLRACAAARPCTAPLHRSIVPLHHTAAWPLHCCKAMHRCSLGGLRRIRQALRDRCTWGIFKFSRSLSPTLLCSSLYGQAGAGMTRRRCKLVCVKKLVCVCHGRSRRGRVPLPLPETQCRPAGHSSAQAGSPARAQPPVQLAHTGTAVRCAQ